ncbi:MAG: polysaccharide biosynthesis C-terminal domain-containing protein, partial [Syntrophorhabdaceae bacterium]|nr:polysaccharide biosynthesis C-terminal domain-containing protein [Syntrophorhabdaceae bacterium]
HGWSQWALRPAEGATGNVSILAALYVAFGNDPALIIPFNAVIHATSGLLVFLIARLLWPGRVGVYSGVITASLFIVFPSALNWYAQIHKDGFAILGMLIIFYSWLNGTQHSSRMRGVFWVVFGTLAGVALVTFVRPYNIKLLIMSGVVLCLALWVYLILKKRIMRALSLTGLFCIFIVVFMVINSYMPKIHPVEKKDELIGLFKGQGIDWNWKRSKVIPSSVDQLFENTTLIRVTNIYHVRLVKAQSAIDEEVRPDNIWSSIAYLPRAAFVALFAPFPDKWFENTSVIRLVSVGETAIWYLLVPGVFLAFWYRRSLQLLLMTLNALVFLTILGFANPIVGTLYRFRYVYLFVLMLIGVMGWMELVRRKYGEKLRNFTFRRNDEDFRAERDDPLYEADPQNSRSTIITAGFAVIVFTLLSNVLLVARDVVLARWFGLSNELDAFFVAMIVPMFLVTVLSIPVGTVMIPPLMSSFREESQKKTQQLITLCSTTIFCTMFFLSLLLYVFGRYYLPVIGWGFSGEKILLSQRILVIVLPILFFSGFVILGNCILNARQKFALPALAQAIVPVIAILALFAAAKQIGIYAMAIGMLLGQLVNLLIVDHYVKKEGYTIFPRIRPSAMKDLYERSSKELKSLLSQYAPLVFAALFVSLALPVNNVIAASLAPGSVSAFNLGMKFIVFFTGLIGTGISTVMLPHFSSYFAGNRVMDAKKELSFFLFLSTVIPMPLTVVIFLLTGPMINLIFGGGLFTVNDIGMVARIMEYGIIQLPFFCTNMLLVKFANARKKNALITITSLSGLIVNILLNLIFIGKMGVAGIALASSLSVVFATALFIVVGHRYSDISWVDATFTALAWLLYLTVLLYHHYNNVPGIIVTSVFLVSTIVYHLMKFFEHKLLPERRTIRC